MINIKQKSRGKIDRQTKEFLGDLVKKGEIKEETQKQIGEILKKEQKNITDITSFSSTINIAGEINEILQKQGENKNFNVLREKYKKYLREYIPREYTLEKTTDLEWEKPIIIEETNIKQETNIEEILEETKKLLLLGEERKFTEEQKNAILWANEIKFTVSDFSSPNFRKKMNELENILDGKWIKTNTGETIENTEYVKEKKTFIDKEMRKLGIHILRKNIIENYNMERIQILSKNGISTSAKNIYTLNEYKDDQIRQFMKEKKKLEKEGIEVNVDDIETINKYRYKDIQKFITTKKELEEKGASIGLRDISTIIGYDTASIQKIKTSIEKLEKKGGINTKKINEIETINQYSNEEIQRFIHIKKKLETIGITINLNDIGAINEHKNVSVKKMIENNEYMKRNGITEIELDDILTFCDLKDKYAKLYPEKTLISYMKAKKMHLLGRIYEPDEELNTISKYKEKDINKLIIIKKEYPTFGFEDIEYLSGYTEEEVEGFITNKHKLENTGIDLHLEKCDERIYKGYIKRNIDKINKHSEEEIESLIKNTETLKEAGIEGPRELRIVEKAGELSEEELAKIRYIKEKGVELYWNQSENIMEFISEKSLKSLKDLDYFFESYKKIRKYTYCNDMNMLYHFINSLSEKEKTEIKKAINIAETITTEFENIFGKSFMRRSDIEKTITNPFFLQELMEINTGDIQFITDKLKEAIESGKLLYKNDYGQIHFSDVISLIHLYGKNSKDMRIKDMHIKASDKIQSTEDIIKEMFLFFYDKDNKISGIDYDQRYRETYKEHIMTQLKENIPDLEEILIYFDIKIDSNELFWTAPFYCNELEKMEEIYLSNMHHIKTHPDLKKTIKENYEIKSFNDLMATVNEIRIKTNVGNTDMMKKLEIAHDFFLDGKMDMKAVTESKILEREYSIEFVQWLVSVYKDTGYNIMVNAIKYQYPDDKAKILKSRYDDRENYEKAKKIGLFTDLNQTQKIESSNDNNNLYAHRRIEKLFNDQEYIEFLLKYKDLNLVNFAILEDNDIGKDSNHELKTLYEKEKTSDFKHFNFTEKIHLFPKFDNNWNYIRQDIVDVIKNREKICECLDALVGDEEMKDANESEIGYTIRNIIDNNGGSSDIPENLNKLKYVFEEIFKKEYTFSLDQKTNILKEIAKAIKDNSYEGLKKQNECIRSKIKNIDKKTIFIKSTHIEDTESIGKFCERMNELDMDKYINFLIQIGETSYSDETKEKMINKILSLGLKSAEKYIETFQIFNNSISQDIQHIKNELIEQVLNTENPREVAEKINGIFTKNNLPLVGKIYKVFNELYKDDKLDQMFTSYPKLSPILRNTKNNKQKRAIMYRDLLNINIKSGNQSLKKYIDVFLGSQKTLKDFEQIIKNLDLSKEVPLEGILTEKDQEKLLYLFRKIDTLYESTSGNILSEPDPKHMETMKYGQSTVNDKLLIEYYITIKKHMLVREGESLYDSMVKFLKPIGCRSFEEVLKKMNESKSESTERGLRYINSGEEGKLSLEGGDFLKGIGNTEILKNILDRGCTSREYLGGGDEAGSGKASSDMTPFDIDGGLVTNETTGKSFANILGESPSSGYGNIVLVIKGKRGSMIDTSGDNIQGYTNDKYELFHTGAVGAQHYGIRTGIPSTEIDLIVRNGGKTEEIFYEIAKNGFYIPVVDKEGNIIFTPETYHSLRLGFNYAEKFSGFDIKNEDGRYIKTNQDNKVNIETDKKSKHYKLIDENKSDNPKYKEYAQKNIKMRDMTLQKIKHILEENNIKINSEFDFSIEGAQVNDTGSTGRETDIPTGDVDLDFTVLLDARDYKRIDEIIKKIHEEIGTTEKGIGEGSKNNGYQLKSKKNKLGNEVENRPDGISLDLLFMKKTQVIEYSSSDAAKDRLKYILKTYGKETYDQVRANIVIMKKLLKAKTIYKKGEGGISGIGVENWILQNHGSFIEALESFEDRAYEEKYEEGKTPCNFSEFQKKYQIYDPGENYKDGGKDNYISKMSETGYNGTLEIIRTYRKKGMTGIKDMIDEYARNKEIFGAI